MESSFLSREEIERCRRMSPTEKLAEVAALNRAEDERQRAEIRAEYGNISDEEMRVRLGVLRFGRETMTKLLGRDPDGMVW